MIAVIGSGHAGIAAAKRLVTHGYRPVIFDVGESLDGSRRATVDRMKLLRPINWDDADVAQVSKNETVHGHKPLRLAFGSAYPYASERSAVPLDRDDDGPTPSFARGGFSTVWGAAMLPAAACDFVDWPFPVSELAPYYELALQGLPFSAVTDGLARQFPLYKAERDPLSLTPATQVFLDRLSASASLRDRDDLAFGQARLAVRASTNSQGVGCEYCGLCLSGCVYGAIYSTEQELERLQRDDRVDYRPGRVVRTLVERGDQVEIVCNRLDGTQETQVFDRVFLAAGAINSTRIVLESKGFFGRAVEMKSTAGFVLPMLQLRGAAFDARNANTLASLFLEFKLPSISDHWIHTQISAPNELVQQRLDFQPNRGHLRDRALGIAFNHLLIAMCNFHSDHAATYELSLRPPHDGGSCTLKIATRASASFPGIAKQAIKRMVRLLCRVGVFPLVPFVQGADGQPRGWHFGGTLPMSSSPRHPFETDLLGRPDGWSRVHVVDSSVFPSLPGTTIALLAMANAMRITDAAIAH